MKKETKTITKNLRNFLWARDYTHAQFAEMINEKLEKNGVKEKADYDVKNVGTWVGRGSEPNIRVQNVIAQLMGVALMDLHECEFTQKDFGGKEEKIKMISIDNIAEIELRQKNTSREGWDISRLAEMTPTEREFVFDLISTGIYEDDGSWHSFFDIGLKYNKGKTVTATLYYGDEYEIERKMEWTWNDYGKAIEAVPKHQIEIFGDAETIIIENRIFEELFEKLMVDESGLVESILCYSCGYDELPDERYADADRHFVANVFYAIQKNEIIDIMKKIVERAEKKVADLLEHSKMSMWQEKKE